MLNFTKRLLLLLLALILVCCGDILKDDISSMESVAQLSADELLLGLEGNEDFFKEEIISVTGLLVEINTKNDHINILIKGNTIENHYIICEMNQSFKLPHNQFLPGETVEVKGILKGYLNDAVLLNCVLDNTHVE